MEPEFKIREIPLTLTQYQHAGTVHANCKHEATKKARANCRKIRIRVASFTPMTDNECSAAMRAGTTVTGWNVYDTETGVVLREITGTLDYVEERNGKKIWTIRFTIDPTGKTCSPALESAGTYPAERIRVA